MRLLVLALGLLSLILHEPLLAAGKELVVGVQPYQPTRALITYHEKLATHLRGTLKRPVRIVTARDVETFGNRMLAGDYDLAIAPAHLARLAQLDRGWHPLARYVPDTPTLLIARKEDDTATTVASLRGKVLATHGRLRLVSVIAEHWLADQQLLVERDFRPLETASPASAVHALVSGEADMAVVNLASMSQVIRSEVEQVRIVHEFPSTPLLVFIARNDMTPETRAQMQRALLAYQSPQGNRPVAAGAQDLASMDVYVDETRRLLQIRAPQLQLMQQVTK